MTNTINFNDELQVSAFRQDKLKHLQEETPSFLETDEEMLDYVNQHIEMVKAKGETCRLMADWNFVYSIALRESDILAAGLKGEMWSRWQGEEEECQ